MATTKMVVYYRVGGGTKVNRSYFDFDNSQNEAQNLLRWKATNPQRIYLEHEPHDEYTAAYAAAGMVGADEDDIRDWLDDRVADLQDRRAAAHAAKQATLIPGTGTGYGGAKPGDIVRDQHGRSGRVPHVPLEVFRAKPIDPDTAMDAVRDFCKGGGGTVPRS